MSEATKPPVFIDCTFSSDVLIDAGELARLRKDAERYRKWRHDYTTQTQDQEGASDMLLDIADAWTPAEVDAAIDAAMARDRDSAHLG